ncbi:MAG: hypothetical protein KA105_07800 [Caulobacter sp.]|nr:hypothetical protein [Caulobacter sp.]
MTFRERYLRVMSSFWGSALAMGALWSAFMLGSGFILPWEEPPSIFSFIVTPICGAGFGIAMAFFLKSARAKAAERLAETPGRDQA